MHIKVGLMMGERFCIVGSASDKEKTSCRHVHKIMSIQFFKKTINQFDMCTRAVSKTMITLNVKKKNNQKTKKKAKKNK